MKSTNAISTTGRMPAIAAPVAIPMNPVSEIGVSMTRAAPNSSAMPTVVPNTPPSLAMSSPIRNMFGFLRISLNTASRPARAMVRVRSEPGAPDGAGCAMVNSPSGVQALERVGCVGVLALAAETHRCIDLLLNLGLERSHIGRRRHCFAEQPLAVRGNRIDHRLALGFGTIAAAVTDEMPVQPLGFQFQNRSALTAPGALHRTAGSLENQ